MSFPIHRPVTNCCLILDKLQNKYPQGEVGILKKVAADPVLKRCFLTIEYDNDLYIGYLFVSDHREQLFAILQQRLGWTVEQIGGLDVSHLD